MQKDYHVGLKSNKGFTLLEMVIAAGITAYALCGMLAMYISCFDLIATSKNTGIATAAANGLMEEIRSSQFSDIPDVYDQLNFVVGNMPQNRGVVYINATDPEFLRVTISVCWRQNQRYVGEDRDLDGALDAGEDTITVNNMIDSPVQLVTQIANR
jgi:hypothetical protein